MNQMLSTPIQNADKNARQNNIFEPNPISHQMRHSLQLYIIYTINIGCIYILQRMWNSEFGVYVYNVYEYKQCGKNEIGDHK